MKTTMFYLFSFLLLFSVETLAGDSKRLNYTGQSFETFDMNRTRTVTRYRTETRDSTCTRQVPYQKEVCGYVTRYERECRWEPGRQRCYTDYRQECRNVTRYRQQCTQGPSRQVCRTLPGRRQCRTLPNGQQRCRTVPGRRVCETKPGRRQCRQVPYTARECRQVPYQRCEQTPGRNVCRDVPRQVWECRNETRYRTEEYPCQKQVQVPYQVQQEVVAKVDVNFEDKTDLSLAFEIVFNLLENGSIEDTINTRDVLIARDRDIDTNDRDELETNARYTYTLYNPADVLAPVRKEVQVTHLTPWYLSFIIGKSTLPGTTKVNLDLKKTTGENLFTGEISEANATFDEQSYGYFVTVRLKDLDVEVQPGDFVDLSLSLSQNVPGIINLDPRDTSRTDRFSAQEVK